MIDSLIPRSRRGAVATREPGPEIGIVSRGLFFPPRMLRVRHEQGRTICRQVWMPPSPNARPALILFVPMLMEHISISLLQSSLPRREPCRWPKTNNEHAPTQTGGVVH